MLASDDRPIIFDIDLHDIPPHKSESAHQHFDCRFLFKVSRELEIKCSDESNDLKWIHVDKLSDYSQETSLLRMHQKTQQLTF